MATFELYRGSTIGICLTETLNEMITKGTLNPELAIRVLLQFDKSIAEAFKNIVRSKVYFKGHLHTYRYTDSVWTFILHGAFFDSKRGREIVPRVKIVACDSKLLDE